MPKVRIWKQDPSVESIGVRTSFITTPMQPGPKDGMVEIVGLDPVNPDENGDYLADPVEDGGSHFDAVHTFAVTRQVVTMFERAMARSGYTDQPFKWLSDEPLKVYPAAGEDTNAYYSRGEHALKFFYFRSGSSMIYTCRSFDIVAHETGHAVLDSLRPGYLTSSLPQTGALHESFGDLTAIFTMLAQMDQCEAIVAESAADLHNHSFFPAVAEQFGEALGRPMGLRNADNDLMMSEVGDQVHELSQVFTGAVYDILADIFGLYTNYRKYDPAETLYRVGKHMTSLVLLSILNTSESDVTYQELAERMIEIEPVVGWKSIIRNQFARRGVL